MLEELKSQLCRSAGQLAGEGLIARGLSGISAVDRSSGRVVACPADIPWTKMDPKRLVVVSLESGEVVEGSATPAGDTPTHLELYRAFGEIAAVTHTHSLYATAWAQARQAIPPLGTVHVEHFSGSVPCTRLLKAREITDDYDVNVAGVIIEQFAGLNPLRMPAVLVAGDGAFTWSPTIEAAATCAIALERIARLASETLRIIPYPRSIPPEMLQRRFSQDKTTQRQEK